MVLSYGTNIHDKIINQEYKICDCITYKYIPKYINDLIDV